MNRNYWIIMWRYKIIGLEELNDLNKARLYLELAYNKILQLSEDISNYDNKNSWTEKYYNSSIYLKMSYWFDI